MKMIQAMFVRPGEGTDIVHKIVWVGESWNLKVGDVVSFKHEPDVRWSVRQTYITTPIDSEEINTKWGLDLPKSQRTER